MFDPISPDIPVRRGCEEVENLIAMLNADLIGRDDQMRLVEAVTTDVQREMVQKFSTLDASMILTFKKQVALVDTVLRQLVSDEGIPKPGASDFGISLKDALALSLRVTQIMVKDLPKVYSVERIQRQEEALRRVMESHLTRKQQEALLRELEELEADNA